MGGGLVSWLRPRPPEPCLLRLHLRDKPFSIEGVYVGIDAVLGEYRLRNGKHLDEAPDGGARTRGLDGETRVPRENVIYAQVIG